MCFCGRWGCFIPDFDTCQASYFTVLSFSCLMCKMAIKKKKIQASKQTFVSSPSPFPFLSHSLSHPPFPPFFPPSCVRVHKIVNVKYLTYSTEYVYGKIYYCTCLIIVFFLIIAMNLFLSLSIP